MVSMAVSKFGQEDLIFIDTRVKINGAYYRKLLMTQKLLPVVREICGELFISQRDIMLLLPHRTSETVNFQERDTCVNVAR